MKVFMFHLMPWQYLSENFNKEHPSAWITYSNRNYDPVQGATLYDNYLDELCYAEEIGFDGICVNEHHQTAYGLMPSPNVMASALVQRTKHVKIAIIGNAIPLRDHPLRVAEEVAMLGVLSKGRIICGFVRAIGSEYHSFSLDPTTSRERFLEAHDLILKSWMDSGPFQWYGEHYQFSYVNPWPRPYQDSHPSIWIPTQGSGETLEWAAERHYTLLQTFNPIKNIERVLGEYRNICIEKFRYEPRPDQVGWSLPVYVGDSDEAAYEEARPHLNYMVQNLQHRPPKSLFPPGYLSERSMQSVLKAKGAATRYKRYEELIESGYAVVGNPDTVLRSLREMAERAGAGIIVPMMQFGTMTHAQVIKSMERFAENVLPGLKEFLPSVHL
ncbi:LLM class flavin-dependent oxidoreductase [Alicyclobacillus fastidiosus]|uniref:LLM class flavin-dependent oxidoreductase n=1 Tax=Alicyclobacillus fastidiosus TaxID=392011 RepID=A0ABV5AC27_9BACL|nr:LLM class flavin-dependent oxidoreductase [Alicyclobacillus fastidiosus]WEH11471.1 LLM class flavin-dependent oxidoreductase [Alicyclobacillus fastidiosus]